VEGHGRTGVHVDGPSQKMIEGGLGGWGRAGLAALTFVALTKSVATTIAAATIASIILAIVVTVATLALTLAAIARGMRRSRGCVVGVERLRRRHELVRTECEFLKNQAVSDLVEGREQRVVRSDGSKVIIPLVQPLKNVDDETAVGDGVVEVGQGVSHALHLETIVAHREVALDKVAKRGIEVKHTCFTVVDELMLKRAPDLRMTALCSLAMS
jgi:hypothetical protein